MFINRQFDQGQSAVADEAMVSGMLVIATQGSDGKLHVKKLGSGSLNGRVGVIFRDHDKAVNLRPISAVDSSILTGDPASDIGPLVVNGKVATLLYGRGQGMTDQVEDDHYFPGDKLTVDTSTSRLKKAGSGDSVIAQVSLEFEGAKVTSQNTLVPVTLQIGGVGRGQTL